MTESRRRLDQVLASEFVADIDGLELDELRRRRRLADEVENELSYYRRLLHGRMDLLGYEQRRRRGEEDRSIIQALPDILSGGLTSGGDSGADERTSSGRSRHLLTDLPPLPDAGRREVDLVLSDDVLARLSEISAEELDEAIEEARRVEVEISEQRRQVQEVVDLLTAAIADRYRSGTTGRV